MDYLDENTQLKKNPVSNHSKEVVVGIYDKAGKLILDRKTMFPDHIDGFAIVAKFFEVCKNIVQVVPVDKDCWIGSNLQGEKKYRFFVEKISGEMATFFPGIFKNGT